jgi:predicted neutral ceramidase superfamily lipid hydrolase
VLSPEELQRLADEAKRAASKVEDKYKTNAPQETVHDSVDAAQKAANFGEAVKERAGHQRNPELRKELEQAVTALDRARDDLIDRTNAQVAEPNSTSKGRDLEKATQDTRDKIDKVTEEFRWYWLDF